MSLHIQRLAADVLPLSPFASAALGAEGPSSPDPRELEGLILPRGIEDIPRPEDRFDPEERGLLAATLEERLAPLAPPVAVLDSVRALARAGAACVVTGQQPGFLCSPLLSLYKGLHAVRLPGPVAAAFLPHTRYARRLARVAHRHGKEVMLHLPMEAEDGAATGPGTVTLKMTEPEFIRTLQADLANIPHVVGINNHMGSLLTRQPEHMLWLMQAIRRRGELFFVDSRTTAATVAQKVAAENGVPNLRRDVFLDNDPTPTAIAAQFEHLLRLARRHGSAVAIGHPHEETLEFLARRLPHLEAEGIQLVPVQSLLDHRQTPERHHAVRPAELASAIGSDPAQKPLATP